MVKLDGFEAHPIKYKRFTTSVKNELGEERVVEAYEVVEKSSEQLIPSREYHGILINAAKKHDYPDLYQKFLASIKVQD